MTKHYNWTTGPNHKYVDEETNRVATAFIDQCTHLTPEKTAELDNLLAEADLRRNVPKSDDATTVCEPDPEVIKAAEALSEPDWMNAEPDDDAYEHDNALERLRENERARAAY